MVQCTEEDTAAWMGWIHVANALINLAAVVGMIGSGLLLRACLQEGQRSILGRLVTWVAVADLSLNVWSYVTPWIWNHSLLMRPVVSWCGLFIPVQRVLQLWVAILPAGIALAILLALVKLPRALKWMRIAPAASLPLAILLNLGAILDHSRFMYIANGRPQAFCGVLLQPKEWAASLFSFPIEILGIFTLIFVIHLYGVWRVQKLSPAGVAKRAFNCASRFLLAFVAAWFVAAGFLLFSSFGEWVAGESCTLHVVLPSLQDFFIALSGFFNFLAYKGASLQEDSRQGRVVTFGRPELVTFGRQDVVQLLDPPEETETWALLWSFDESSPPRWFTEADRQGGSQSSFDDSSSSDTQSQVRGIGSNELPTVSWTHGEQKPSS